MAIEPRHTTNAALARSIYLDNLQPESASEDWLFAKRAARKQVAATLRATSYLADLEGALLSDGGHTLVLRQLLAPPLSQDQFKLGCPQWSKGSEKTKRGLSQSTVRAVADALRVRLDRSTVRWNIGSEVPLRRDVEIVLRVTSSLMAVQHVATARRNRLAFEQEYAVVTLLENDGWSKLASRLIDTRAAVPTKTFMRKTRFGTNTTAHQEVDIACGLKGSYVLAMECKVTNDETNSVKRINDVLKKASAWRAHWGSFVITAALLSGVIAPKDVQRLTDSGIEVFWSHDLEEFRSWLSFRLNG